MSKTRVSGSFLSDLIKLQVVEDLEVRNVNQELRRRYDAVKKQNEQLTKEKE